MYRETLRAEQREDDGASSEGGGKVNTICNAFLEALASRKANVKNMVTAQVCKNPPDLDAGLIEIVRLRGKSRILGYPYDDYDIWFSVFWALCPCLHTHLMESPADF